jgi:hypothetical protein
MFVPLPVLVFIRFACIENICFSNWVFAVSGKARIKLRKIRASFAQAQSFS